MKTPWFGPTDKPKRKGAYEWKCALPLTFPPLRMEWDGKTWRHPRWQGEWGPCDSCRWRGFTEKQ